MGQDDPTWWQAKREGQANPPRVPALIPAKQFQERCRTLPNYSGYQFNIIGLKNLTINNNCSDTNSYTSCEMGWSVGVEDRTRVRTWHFLMKVSQAFRLHPEIVFHKKVLFLCLLT